MPPPREARRDDPPCAAGLEHFVEERERARVSCSISSLQKDSKKFFSRGAMWLISRVGIESTISHSVDALSSCWCCVIAEIHAVRCVRLLLENWLVRPVCICVRACVRACVCVCQGPFLILNVRFGRCSAGNHFSAILVVCDGVPIRHVATNRSRHSKLQGYFY